MTLIGTPGVSPVAAYVDQEARRGRENLQATEAFGLDSALRAELEEVWGECQRPNWDGYGALPVSQGSLHNTYILLESLPLGFPSPSVGAQPDGNLTLEWHRSPSRSLSISVDPEGLLHYAALIGPRRKYGTETFYTELPGDILRLVREVNG